MEIIKQEPQIYVIGGKARRGKTTTSQYLITEFKKQGKKPVRLFFIKYVKDYIKDYFGWDGRDETKPREFLQVLGTDIIREKLGKNYFCINRMIEDIEILSCFFDVIVIDDARYKIEIEALKAKFANVISIQLIRNNFDDGLTEKQRNHITELDLDDYDKFDYKIINDETLAVLEEKVITLIRRNW